jgi:hypothetical protein
MSLSSSEAVAMRGFQVWQLPCLLVVTALLLTGTEQPETDKAETMKLRPLEFPIAASPVSMPTPWDFRGEITLPLQVNGLHLGMSLKEAVAAYRCHCQAPRSEMQQGFKTDPSGRLTRYDGCCLGLADDPRRFRSANKLSEVMAELGEPVRTHYGAPYCGSGPERRDWYRVPGGYLVLLSLTDDETVPPELQGKVHSFVLSNTMEP